MAIPWSTTPPPVHQQRPLTLVRVPPGRPVSGIITVERAVYLPTHFWTGRTVPCFGSECEACAAGAGARSHGYLGIFTQQDHKHQLLELTLAAAEPLAEYFQTYGTLRGCWMIAKRAKPAANSRIEMQLRPADITKIPLPREPDILAALATIWRLPADAFSQVTDEPATTALAIDADTLRKATHSTRSNGKPHEARRAQTG